MYIPLYTILKINVSPEKGPFQKGSFNFQPSICRGYIKFQGGDKTSPKTKIVVQTTITKASKTERTKLLQFLLPPQALQRSPRFFHGDVPQVQLHQKLERSPRWFDVLVQFVASDPSGQRCLKLELDLKICGESLMMQF